MWNDAEKTVRTDWTVPEVENIYYQPLIELIYRAATIHRQFHDPLEVQVCTLLSIKTGGCSEDCSYCPQSVHYQVKLKVHPLLPLKEVVSAAQKVKETGATRFCMGAAWRELPENRDFERVLKMVKAVNDLGLEVCCTLGMLTREQAIELKRAGLYAYNHNIDTSENYYHKIITTHTYQQRLETLKNISNAGIKICCGGIIGLGESDTDRIDMLHTLATFEPHPESVPINALVPIEGTPLADQKRVPVWDMIRMIATARILMPKSMIRLSAGRLEMSREAQALCFLAGANSIFSGEKLLTTPNPSLNEDETLFELLGLKKRKAFKEQYANTFGQEE